MPKRIIRTLTGRVKEKIKKEYRTLKKSDYGDDALTYLNRVKGAAKGRNKKKQTIAKVGELVIPKDSEMYRIIEKAAKINKMTVKQFIKKHRESISDLMQKGDVVIQRETEYLIKDLSKLPKGKKVFINDNNGYVKTPKLDAILQLQQFTQAIFGYTDIFIIVYRVHYKLIGDITFYLPPVREYDDLSEPEDFEALLDEYYPEITYIKSPKRNERRKKETIKERGNNKGKKKSTDKPDNGRKRKVVHKKS